MKHSLLIAFFLILGLGLLSSCASTVSEKPKIDLVWPLPPDEPRVQYVDTIMSTSDLGRKMGISETLFGEENVEGFTRPYGVAVDKQGRIYVTDVGRVIMFDLKNKNHELIGVDAGLGRLRTPIGIAVISDGRLFVTDTADDRVYVYLNGKFSAALGQTGEFESPSGVAVDEKQGLIYVADTRKHLVSVYSLNNYAKLRTIGSRGTEAGEFNFPTNIAVDQEGKLYVVDTANFRVQIFDRDGKFLRSIGKLGDMPGSLARPKGIDIDSEGHIYIIDTAFQNFQIFDQEGNILLIVGEAGTAPGRFLLPAGLTIDDEDRIYVVDQIPGSVQIFQYLGKKWKKQQ